MFTKKNLLTPNEQRFFYCLKQAFPENYIAVQVALSAMVESEYNERAQYRTYYSDFVICDNQTFEPKLVIELDDKTHNRQKRIEQDKRKNMVLTEAKIPLYRYTAKKEYSIDEIIEKIEPFLTGKAKPPELPCLEKKTENSGNKRTGCATLILAIVISITYFLFL